MSLETTLIYVNLKQGGLYASFEGTGVLLETPNYPCSLPDILCLK